MGHHPAGLLINRREALRLGTAALAGMASASLLASPAYAGVSSPYAPVSFDDDWHFFRGELQGAELSSYDDSQWRVLDLPHDWSIEDRPGGSSNGAATRAPDSFSADKAKRTAPSPIGPFDRTEAAGGKRTGWTVGGEGWYRKHFTRPPLAAQQRLELRFDGAHLSADVFLNGHLLGSHAYGYTQFGFDLTPYLVEGDNLLAVRVRNQGNNSRWYAGSGLYRHTWLRTHDAAHIPFNGVALLTPTVDSSKAVVSATVTVRNDRTAAIAATVRVTLLDSAGQTVGSAVTAAPSLGAAQQQSVVQQITVNQPALWSPDSPVLYRCHTEVLIDGVRVDECWSHFGIRSIAFDAEGFRLNGVTMKLRGANIHHDHGPLGAVSLDRSEERRIQILKAAGFNAIRLAHNPHNPRLLDICDRLGMLVYSEIFDMWDAPKGDLDSGYYQDFTAHWQQDLTQWVRADINHPCVIIRSIGNEINLSKNVSEQHIAALGARLADAVRAIDASRPVCMGGGQAIQPLGRFAQNDAFVDVLDTHYLRKPEQIHADNPGKAMLCSESYIESLDAAWALVEKYPWYVGDFCWTGWDYLGESALGHPVPSRLPPPPDGKARDVYGLIGVGLAAYPWYGAWCGDHDHIGRPRPQLSYRRVIWRLSPIEMMVERPVDGVRRLNAGAWSWYEELPCWTWPVAAGTQMTVRVYTRGDRVVLLLNGSSVGEVTLGREDRCIATFKLPYRTGTLEAMAYSGTTEIGRTQLQTVGSPAALRLRSDIDTLTTSRDALAHVMVEVVDAQGRVVPDAVYPIDLSVSGGTLAGFSNGNPHNLDSFQSNRRWTFLGGALAVLRPSRSAGVISLTAQSSSLKAASLAIPVVTA